MNSRSAECRVPSTGTSREPRAASRDLQVPSAECRVPNSDIPPSAIRHPQIVIWILLAFANFFWPIVFPAGAAEFRQALPGYRFQFPRDHYSHDDYRTEWWYYTGHLRTEHGEEYGFELTFFRSGLAQARTNPSTWAAKNLYLAHFAVSDLNRKTFTFYERLGRAAAGQAGASETELKVWVGDWLLDGDGTTQHLRAAEGTLGLDLTLTSEKPAVIHGEAGVSRKGQRPSQASHYYSLTRLRTRGSLTIRGQRLDVTGLAWMDHEFGSTQLAPNQTGWDWVSLQLDDRTELMLYLIRRSDGTPDPASSGTWVTPEGTAKHLRLQDFAVDILDHWTSPQTGGRYPMAWRIRVPESGLELTVTPAFPEQELNTKKSTQVVYWEGAVSASGTASSGPVRGSGYVEMTGYAGAFQKKL